MLSAKTGENMDRLVGRMRMEARRIVGTRTITLSLDDTKAIEDAYSSGRVISADYTDTGVVFTMRR